MARAKRHSWLTYLLAASLLLQVLLPFFATYQLPQAQGVAQLSKVLGEKILICSGEGFRWAKWEDLVNEKTKPQPHTKYKCPTCYVAAHNTFTAKAMPALHVPDAAVSTAHSPFFEISDIVPGDIRWSRLLNRAPPAAA